MTAIKAPSLARIVTQHFEYFHFGIAASNSIRIQLQFVCNASKKCAQNERNGQQQKKTRGTRERIVKWDHLKLAQRSLRALKFNANIFKETFSSSLFSCRRRRRSCSASRLRRSVERKRALTRSHFAMWNPVNLIKTRIMAVYFRSKRAANIWRCIAPRPRGSNWNEM